MLKNAQGEKRAAYTQLELLPVLADHARYVQSRGGRRAVLAHADLSGLNIANKLLSDADLSGASLVGASLCGSNLERASLYCADLRDCDLRTAKLERADMRGASFRGAKLAYAKLDGADLRAAMMMVMGDAGVSVINRGTMRGDDGGKPSGPMGVDFSNASLKHVSFGSARLDGAKFDGALLQGANFRGAKMTNVSFRGAILTGVKLEELGVPPEALEGCLLDISPEARAKAPELKARIEAHGQWILSGGKDGRPANLDGEDLRPLRAHLTGRPLAGLSARNAIAAGVDFSGCQLQASHFEGADLRDSNFTEADLRGAALAGAKIAHARFERANLCGLPLSNGNTKAVDLSGTMGKEEQFTGAVLDAKLVELGLVAL